MSDVATFYSGSGGLVETIGAALEAAGLSRDALRPADLAPVDEFHIRGRAATLEIVGALGLTSKSH
ncbi:MAG: class I SAM-dependent methyltransferase, partial [Pseudolysinimonas sp.]